MRATMTAYGIGDEDHLERPLVWNGSPTRPALDLHDGFTLDTSMSLPQLDRILNDSERIIAERRDVRKPAAGAHRSCFEDVWTPEDCDGYPAFLDFATSSDLLATVSRHLRSIPALSMTLPSGIRFVESNVAFDDQPDEPHDSQFYHIDYYSLPNVYVLVLLEDTTHEQCPWKFLPRGRSQEVRSRLGCWGERCGYRLSDDVYSIAGRDEAIEFAGSRGSVLFIESSGCLHFGSRNSIKPRLQLMLAYTGAIRADLSGWIGPAKTCPVRENDSLLRRMVLDKDMQPLD